LEWGGRSQTYTHTREEESTLQRPPYKDLPNANCVKKGGGGGCCALISRS